MLVLVVCLLFCVCTVVWLFMNLVVDAFVDLFQVGCEFLVLLIWFCLIDCV